MFSTFMFGLLRKLSLSDRCQNKQPSVEEMDDMPISRRMIRPTVARAAKKYNPGDAVERQKRARAHWFDGQKCYSPSELELRQKARFGYTEDDTADGSTRKES